MIRRTFLKTLVAAAGIAAVGCHSKETEGKEPDKPAEKKALSIVILTGSPRRGGNSSYLADRFTEGAKLNGHSVTRFDTAFLSIKPCIGCNHCGMNGPCIFDDDFTKMRDPLIHADLVVFASPMYYFGFSAQLKAAIDRFYAINGRIKGSPKKAVFLMTYANTSPKEADAMKKHYQSLLEYLGWSDAGMVIAPGVWNVGDIKRTSYGDKAYELGKKIK